MARGRNTNNLRQNKQDNNVNQIYLVVNLFVTTSNHNPNEGLAIYNLSIIFDINGWKK